MIDTQPPLFPPNENAVLGSLRDRLDEGDHITLTRAEVVDYYFLLRDTLRERDELRRGG